MKTYKGIDVSKHNGNILWENIEKSGIEFAMIRAGFGQCASQVDPQFENNYKGAKARGIACGAYWFSYATNISEAKAEAELCLKTIANKEFEYPIAFDFEYDSVNYALKKGITITKELATKIADTFLSTVKAAGYAVILYSNLDYLKNYFTLELQKKYDLWLAQWSSKEPQSGQKIWQSGTTTINGAKYDYNTSYFDYPAYIKENGLNGYDKPEESYKDICGHWGEEAMRFCIENKIMVGYGDNLFHPNETATRAQLAQTIYNLKEYLNK